MQRRLSLLTLIVASSIGLFACSGTPDRTAGNSRQPTGSSYSAQSSAKGGNIAMMAQSMLGKPYNYGGSTPHRGFDCSGLVFFTHTQVGDYVPRTSREQLKASRTIRLDELEPGDLLFYRINGKPSHVGIYIGNNQFIHAPSSGKTVSIANLDNPYFQPRLIRAGRLYKE